MPKPGVIGLDIGTTHVRAAEVIGGRGAGQGTLVRFGQVPLPMGAVRDGEVVDHDSVSAAPRRLWAEAKFPSRDVNIGVGNQRVVVRELDLPWMPLPQLRASLPFQVQEMLPMSTDEALLDFCPTGEGNAPAGRTVHGLLVAATKDTVRANVLTVESAGLRPQLVDLSPFALLRSIVRGDLTQRTVAVVDIGARITQVAIAAHGIPRFVRILPSGGQNATDAVASAMGVSAPEAEGIKRQIGVGFTVPEELTAAGEALSTVVQPLVEAIRNTLVYYAGNNPGAGIELVVLTGGGAHLPGLGQYLSSASRLAVSMGDPLATLTVAKSVVGERLPEHPSMLTMPIGLAYGVAA